MCEKFLQIFKSNLLIFLLCSVDQKVIIGRGKLYFISWFQCSGFSDQFTSDLNSFTCLHIYTPYITLHRIQVIIIHPRTPWYTLIHPHTPSYTLIHPHTPSFAPSYTLIHTPSYTLKHSYTQYTLIHPHTPYTPSYTRIHHT